MALWVLLIDQMPGNMRKLITLCWAAAEGLHVPLGPDGVTFILELGLKNHAWYGFGTYFHDGALTGPSGFKLPYLRKTCYLAIWCVHIETGMGVSREWSGLFCGLYDKSPTVSVTILGHLNFKKLPHLK